MREDSQPKPQLFEFYILRIYMKRLVYLSGILASCLAISTQCGCSNRTGNAAADSSLILKNVIYSDSVCVDSSSATCKISVEYPDAGPQPLTDSVRQWIASLMYRDAFSGYDRKFDLTSGNESGQQLVNDYGDSLLASARGQLVELDSLFAVRSSLEYESSIKMIYSTPKLVTFSSTVYVYLGGAHGGTTGVNCTFDATTGTSLGWNIFVPGSEEKLREIVSEGLKTQFFNTREKGESIQDMLLVDADSIPLPVTQPYFMADGLHFLYQQYEIAPYSEGMPGCVIPYAGISDLLYPAVSALLP